MTEELQEDPGGELERLAPLVHIEIGRKHKRPMCLSCNRPASVCWCCAVDSSVLREVRCRVVVLQHPHEEKRCLRTAPMLENSLPHCTVFKGKRFSPDVVPELVSPDSVVLFPGADAADVGSLATVAERGRPYNLIVIDGTWHQARAIMHKTKELRALRKVVVRSPVVSHYVIRTQPSDAAVSTVECAALALAALESNPEIYTTLVRPLTTLCQYQLSHGAVVHQSKEHHYRAVNAPAMGKRTAKTLVHCGASLPDRSTGRQEDYCDTRVDDGTGPHVDEDMYVADQDGGCELLPSDGCASSNNCVAANAHSATPGNAAVRNLMRDDDTGPPSSVTSPEIHVTDEKFGSKLYR